MKFDMIILLLLASFFSCSKKEDKPLNAFDAEVFSISMGEMGFETTFKVKLEGFIQTEAENKFSVDITMNVDLITPEKKEIKNFAQSNINESFAEKQYPHINLETSGTISPELGTGNFIANFFIKDNKKNQTVKISKEFSVQ